jgi:hypothetical protein
MPGILERHVPELQAMGVEIEPATPFMRSKNVGDLPIDLAPGMISG